MSSTGHLPELDLLRGQVADLSRELAERDRTLQDLREQSALLRAIAEGTAAETGEEFFASLVTHLTVRLKVQYAVIGEVQGDRVKTIRTLAVSAGGALVDNFEYELAHTPCATALTQTFAFFDRGVQATFPQFQRLADLGAESYCAVPLRAKNGAVMGLLVVMDIKPLEHSDDLQSLLGVFAPRIAAEFERRRAEQERAQALGDLDNVIETIPDVVFALNTQGNLVKWNRRLSDVTGYSPEELLHMPALAFVPPEEQTHTATAIQRAFTEGYAELEGHLLTKDHRLIPYHWTGAALKNPQGEPIGITGIGRDVSGKKRAEETLYKLQEELEAQVVSRTADLQQTQTLLQNVIDSSPDWIFVKDLDHRFLLVNRSFAASQRLRPSDMHGHVDSEFWPRELCEGNPAKGIRGFHADDRAAFQGELVRNEYDPATVQDGTLRIFDTYKGPLRQADGRVYGVLCYARDITERQIVEEELQKTNEILEERVADRTAELNAANIGLERIITECKQTEEALTQSERQLRTVLDALPVGVWFTDQSGKPLLGNPAAKQIWSNIKQIGLQTPDGQSDWWETIGSSDALHRWAFSHVLTTGVPSLNETLDFECLDGTKKIIRNSSIPIRDEGGKILGAVVLNEDITLLRQAQETLKLTQFSVDHAVEGFLWIGQDARILHANDAACRMLEYTNDELTAMTLHDIDPNFPPEVWPAHWEELKQQGSLTFESKQWSRTGRVLDTEVTANYLQYEGKEYNCAIMRDIRERKRAEHESHERSQQVLALQRALLEIVRLDNNALTFSEGVKSVTEVVAETLELERVSLWLQSEDWTELVCQDLYERSEARHSSGARLMVGSYPRYFAAIEASLVLAVADALADPRTSELAGGYLLPLGITSMMEFPIRRQGKLIGVLCCEQVGPSRQWSHEVQGFGASVGEAVARLMETAERKRAQAALRASEERYRSLYDETPTMYFTLATDGMVRSVNRFGAEQLGYQVEELIGYSVLGLFHKDDKEAAAASLSDCLATPEITRYWEFRKLRKDGSMMWVRETARVGQSSTGETVVVVSCEEITARKQAEEALCVSEERLNLATRGSNTGIWDWDLETNEVYFSQIWKSMLGYEEHELRGEFSEWDERIHSDDRARALVTVRAYLDGTTPQYELEHRLRHKDGSYRWILARGVTLSDARGVPYRMAGSHIDITERKRMEEALRQRERDLRVAINERERISQDLHDGILQSLFAVGLALESTKLTMSPKNLKMSRASLNQAIDQLNEVMREIRNFIAGLGSDLLQGKSLPTALKKMLASLTEHQATRVRLAVEDRAAKALSTEQSLHLIRVIQEAVSNCIQHGNAQEARVSLKMLKQGVRLSIRDNGHGFNQDDAKRTGHGLANMAARAQKIGGRFTILSKVNKGTSIVLDLPATGQGSEASG